MRIVYQNGLGQLRLFIDDIFLDCYIRYLLRTKLIGFCLNASNITAPTCFFLLKNILSSFYFLGLFKINNTSTFMVCFSSGFSFLFHLHLINFLFRFSSCSSFSLLLLIIGLPLRCCCFFCFL